MPWKAIILARVSGGAEFLVRRFQNAGIADPAAILCGKVSGRKYSQNVGGELTRNWSFLRFLRLIHPVPVTDQRQNIGLLASFGFIYTALLCNPSEKADSKLQPEGFEIQRSLTSQRLWDRTLWVSSLIRLRRAAQMTSYTCQWQFQNPNDS